MRCYGTVYVDAGIIYYVYVHVHVRNILLSLVIVDVTRLLVGARGWRARLIRGNPFVAVSTPTWSRLSLIQVGESMILRLSLLRD